MEGEITRSAIKTDVGGLVGHSLPRVIQKLGERWQPLQA